MKSVQNPLLYHGKNNCYVFEKEICHTVIRENTITYREKWQKHPFQKRRFLVRFGNYFSKEFETQSVSKNLADVCIV